DAGVDPFLQVLVRAENLQHRINGREIEAPEGSREQSTSHRNDDALAVRKRETQGPQEVFHEHPFSLKPNTIRAHPVVARSPDRPTWSGRPLVDPETGSADRVPMETQRRQKRHARRAGRHFLAHRPRANKPTSVTRE